MIENNPMNNLKSREKISEANKGENHPFYGTRRSEETKRRIGEGNKGKRVSPL